MLSRRSFLKNSAAAATIAAGAGALSRQALAAGKNLPLGIQLYSVRQQLPTDWDGTLEFIASCGYKECEGLGANGWFGRAPAQVNQSMKNAGLHLVSAHYAFTDLQPVLDQVIDFCSQLHVQYIICPTSRLRNPPPPRPRGARRGPVPGAPNAAPVAAGGPQGAPGAPGAPGGAPGARRGRGNFPRPPQFTLDDWKFNADQFNLMGAKIKAAGMRFGYHNHTTEFVVTEGQVPLEYLIQNTDPSLVDFEMDIGWVVVGGGDPIALMKKYPTRFKMVHAKDFKPVDPNATGFARFMGAPTELGRGHIDYAPIFDECRAIGIQHCFVEQEGFDIPWKESLQVDAAYLKKLHY